MKLSALSWPEIRAAVQQSPHLVAIVPIAAIEQHGPHLAVSTDTDIVTAIAERVEAALPGEVLLCPVLAYGSSHHHLVFPGTLSLSPDTFARVIVDLVNSLLTGGLQRIVLLNGHGGNCTPTKQALSILSAHSRAEFEPYIALVNYWELAAGFFNGQLPLESAALSHACEYETSLMLHLHPEKVAMERVEKANKAVSPSYIGWENELPYRGVSVGWRVHYTTGNGSSGQPQSGSAVKGEHLLDGAVSETIAFLRDFAQWPFLTDLRPHSK